MKTALIIGISSQDGSILTNFLIKKGGYKIYGSSRNCNDNSFQILNKLSIIDKVDLINLNLGFSKGGNCSNPILSNANRLN